MHQCRGSRCPRRSTSRGHVVQYSGSTLSGVPRYWPRVSELDALWSTLMCVGPRRPASWGPMVSVVLSWMPAKGFPKLWGSNSAGCHLLVSRHGCCLDPLEGPGTPRLTSSYVPAATWPELGSISIQQRRGPWWHVGVHVGGTSGTTLTG